MTTSSRDQSPVAADELARHRLREGTLKDLAMVASDAEPPGRHVDDPLLALMRDGDQAEDLNDAIVHVASCAECRARLTEGQPAHRSVVVVAIEAPRASQRDIQMAAEGSNARLLERGDGRWAAVVDAENAGKLKESLEKPASSVVSRLAVGTPFELPIEELRTARQRVRTAAPESSGESGTDAAEVQVWAQIARKPKPKQGMSAGWILLAVVLIAAAMVAAYLLASGTMKKG